MSQMIPDPLDPTIFFIGSTAEGDFGQQVGAGTMLNVHSSTLCVGRPCVVHHPSDHHMRSWRLNWRDDRGLMERICPHNMGHPDPDEMTYQISMGRESMGVHGCDGCCQRPDGGATRTAN